MPGWVKLYRDIQKHWVWDKKPYSEGQAWLDLIMMANHDDGNVRFGNEFIPVERGGLITSEVKLADRWGWSRHRVRDFLNLLKKDEMIIKNSDSKRTYLNIVNYSVYQDSTTAEEQKKDRSGTGQGQVRDTNKNDKNDKNEKKLFDSSTWAYKFAAGLRGFILENNPTAKVPNEEDLQKWASVFDLIIRVDHRDLDEISEVLIFSQREPFWKCNILSPKSFREKYDRLKLKMIECERKMEKEGI